MNPFLKAVLLTIVIVALALLVVLQLDNTRTVELRKSIDKTLSENTERQVVQYYGQVMASDPQSQCQYLTRLRQKQFDSTYPLAQRIQDYEKNNLLNSEYQNIKNTYFLGLTEIYLSGIEHHKLCGGDEIPLVMFYSEKNDCPDCRAQNRLMPFIAQRCPKVRIYAFPSDSDLTPLQMMTDRYNISKTPTIVINDNKRLVGLSSEDEIIAALKANGAVCDGATVGASIPAPLTASAMVNASS